MCEGRGEFYTNLMSESLEQKGDTKLRRVADFSLKIYADYSSKSWNPPTDLRSATSQKHVIFDRNLFELADWLNTFPRVPFCALFC